MWDSVVDGSQWKVRMVVAAGKQQRRFLRWYEERQCGSSMPLWPTYLHGLLRGQSSSRPSESSITFSSNVCESAKKRIAHHVMIPFLNLGWAEAICTMLFNVRQAPWTSKSECPSNDNVVDILAECCYMKVVPGYPWHFANRSANYCWWLYWVCP